jgi:predicted O-methyltransferase YrrM
MSGARDEPRGVPQPIEIDRRRTSHNLVTVWRTASRIDLDVEGATLATWHPRQILTGYSWDALAAGCLLRGGGPPARVLVLGLAGGTMVRQLLHLAPGIRVVAVEIDAGVLEIARQYLGLSELDVEIVLGDAYDYLAETRERFDAVVDDLFLTGAEDVRRARVPEGETLELLRRVTAPGGVVVANLIKGAGHAVVRRRARNAFREAFGEVRTVRPQLGLNEILVGGEDVRTGAALEGYAGRFREAHDRAAWQALSVRRLAPRPPAPAADGSTKPAAG